MMIGGRVISLADAISVNVPRPVACGKQQRNASERQAPDSSRHPPAACLVLERASIFARFSGAAGRSVADKHVIELTERTYRTRCFGTGRRRNELGLADGCSV